MCKLKRTIFLFAGAICFLFVFSSAAKAQERSVTVSSQQATINYTSRMELFDATEPPKILALPVFQYPESARKNGVEGKMKVSLTLAKNGTVQDVAVEESLPDGVTEAITEELKRLRFEPAKKNGEPVDAKMFFDFTVSSTYGEKNRNASKLQIIEMPTPVYPENYKAQALKGKVYVSILFGEDGRLQILGVRSALPDDFKRSATEAAKSIKFQPAILKKTQKKISQKMTLEYDFKP